VPSNSPPYSQTSIREAPLGGANVLARWSGSAGARGEFQLQAYFDRTTRDERPVEENRNTFDLDFQSRRRWGSRHSIVFGAGYRVTSGDTTSVPPTVFTPEGRTDNLYSAFVQDDVALAGNRLRLTAGTKLEHNDYSGFEVQPSARLLWTFRPQTSLFAAVTRAVRTPSRVETDYATTSLANPAVPAFVRLQPNPGFQPEKLIAYELGFRARPASNVYATVSAFFNQLDDVLSTELLTAFVETSPPPPRLILPVTFANGLHGNSHGAEVTLDWRTTPWLRTTASYAYLDIQLTKDPGSNDVSQERRGEGLSPNHQALLQTSLDLPLNLQVDWIWRYVSRLPAGPVPAYGTSNVRVGWQFAPQFELAVVGQDLHDAHHLEWPSGGGANIEVERRAYVSVTWRR
jgi:iron complex outermembrane receptor protein